MCSSARSKPIAAIGEAVGYQSEAGFQRVFKKHMGLSPARWQAQRETAPARGQTAAGTL
ncbi:AraC family transcriptional regulator [Burkholderia sp. Ac-20353]|nr:AraC family transcriptional regulator [Burkholderia sp. Ac-20353]